MIADAWKLSVYFGESVTSGAELASDSIVRCFAEHGLVASALFRGVEGFGIHRRIHAERFPDVSTDLPLLAMAVDGKRNIEAALDDVDRAVPRGLVTLEHALLATGDDLVRATFPEGPGRSAKLSIYCRSGERAGGRLAYREAVDVLRRSGAAGAIVLAGVDGTLARRRGRARLFGSNGNVPVLIVSVGAAEPLRSALPRLGSLLREPIVTLEAITRLKHDGELLEPPPSRARVSPDVWQALHIYTRQNALVDGRALYSELTRRLREAGAAGATTILGEWGFSSDEVPYGDKLGTLASHRPSYTVYIDRPEKVAEVWPIVDEVTAEHGVVTSLLVPGYRERAGETVHGALRLDDRPEVLPIGAAGGPGHPDVDGESAAAVAEEPARDGEREWTVELVRKAGEFARSRGAPTRLVRVTLIDGEQFYLFDVESGPGSDFVTLYPHPERHDEMVEAADGGLVPPRAVIVPYRSIAKIELLTRAPRGTRSTVAFRISG